MRIYKANNGNEFRLAGLELTERGDILTIFWIKTKKYEERFFSEVEPYLLVGDFAPKIDEPVIVAEITAPKPKQKRKPKDKPNELFLI